MAKSNSTHLLVPGETEWEFWTLAPGAPPTMHSAHPVAQPSEIAKPPQGDVIFLFPVKALTALPMHVPTGDTSLFPDLAATHAERAGLRPDPFAGQLTDIFPVLTSPENSVFLSVVLRNPQPADLPLKSPKAFDISPRAFPARGNTLTLWRELGSWVFAIHSEGKLLYCQATSVTSPSPDASLIREIRIAIAQLSMQGVRAEPSSAIVWSSDPETDTSLLSRSLSLQTQLTARPAPIMPEPLGKLLPADVRAARRAARKRQNIILAAAALAVIYLGTIGYLGYGLWKTNSTTQRIMAEVAKVAPQQEAFRLHIEKWDELEYGIDLNHNTVDILNRIARSIPSGSGLRLTSAIISAEEIRIEGEAPQPQAVNEFSKNLSRNNDLAFFEWQTPEPRQTTRGWGFVFTAAPPAVTP
ncbi:hypothetical protein HZ994_05500 [Akkermansiaceae bacterium]|nr:hypothetical protein HZ994_05500 [Akkermansiaceae bacterium]